MRRKWRAVFHRPSIHGTVHSATTGDITFTVGTYLGRGDISVPVLVGNKSGSWYSGLFVCNEVTEERLIYSDRIAKQKMMTSVPHAGRPREN